MAKPVRDSDRNGDGTIHRLRRALGRMLLGEPAEPIAGDARNPRAARLRLRTERRGYTDATHLVDQIRDLVGASAEPLVGRLNMIGLNKIRERFGSEWTRLAQRAERIACNVIEKHLVPGDIYAKWGEDSFVVVFARLSEQNARIKCYLIANEISRSLLGEESSELLEIKTAISRVDRAIDFASLSGLDDLLEAAKPIPPLGPDEALMLVEREDGAEVGSDAEGTQDAFESPFGAPPELEAISSEYVMIPIERPRRAPKVMTGIRGDVLAGMDFVFRPIWNPTLNVIATYYCMPRVRLSDVEGSSGDAELAVAGDAEATARLDAATVERVKQEFAEMEAAGRRLIITAPLHFETVSSMSQRRRVAATIAKIGPMNACLVIEIVGVPVGIQKLRIIDIVSPMRAHCRGVSLQMPMETIDFSHVAGAGVAAVGAELTHASKGEFIQIQQLNRFQRAAEKAGLATFVHGARSLSMVAAALGAGFHFIDGDAVASSVPHADRALEFHLADLYNAR